ncbi:MAG: MarR family transcriptional regulator [Streptosporangiales bacterium]|nr:MarR family transcriptional regulator [Streptosporangiales bacterium]
MTLAMYDALVQLSEAPGQQLYMKDLANRLLYSASGLTRLADALERAGYARRQTDPTNRRATLVTLTPEGMTALEAAWLTHARGVQDHFVSHIPSSQISGIASAFRAVTDGLEQATPDGR